MNILTKNIGFLLVLCAVQPSFAAMVNRSASGATSRDASRVSLAVNPTTAAMRRLPTLLTGTTTTATVATTTAATTSSLMDVTECVDAYTECIKDPEVCGFDFEECTTNELFYAKKPQCNSVLLQCSSAGINALFGTTSTTNLSTKNANDEYVYPTAGSILGQFVEAGAINNRLDKSSCVKRYTSCLKKENVCGEDFELCTSDREFKKQKIYCESTLARCTDEGKTELFGSTNVDSNPTTASRLGEMITEGAQLAAKNAVSTCYKVANQCFLNACGENPYRCIINSSMDLVNATDKLNQKNNSTAAEQDNDVINASLVSRYLRGACSDTIGGNKYCHMAAYIHIDGYANKVPTSKDLIDDDLREEVYNDIYSSVMNTPLRDQIQKIANNIEARAKEKCSDAITACAMRSCGSGLGSACYSSVFGNKTKCFDNSGIKTVQLNLNGLPTIDLSGTSCSINGESTYPEIKIGCESIVNTDQNCLYAVAALGNNRYNYTYNNSGAFNVLFPKLEDDTSDPIGVVTRLNKSLAENYNDAAIEKMAKQCKNTAVSCIRSLCGADFKNCYRNRTDVMTDTYATEEGKFDQSMNKVGGVLDFTIVRGLCLETVKNADVCDEHLKIQSIKNYDSKNGAAGWGKNGTVRDAWVGAVSSGYSAELVDVQGEVVETGLCIIDKSKTTNEKCKNKTEAMQCDYVDEDGCLYSVDQLVPRKDYQLSMAADTLFQEVMGDLEKEAQAKYNAKLTAEQHMCRDANSGGIMGRNDQSATYMWAKLKNRRVPKNYSTSGLKVGDFTESNDLYGSFCRARVTIQSDDPDVQAVLQKGKNWSTAYFAVGDVFTCGSWIPQSELEKVATIAACKKAKVDGTIDAKTDCGNASQNDKLKLSVGQQWAQWGAGIGGAGLMGVGMDLLQTKTGLGGLLTTRDKRTSTQKQLMQSYNDAERLFESTCESDEKHQCKDGSGNDTTCFKATSNWVDNKYMIETYTPKVGGGASCKSLHDYMSKVASMAGYDTETGTVEQQGWWDEYGKRATADAVAGLGGGLVAGIGVHNALKAANLQKFTEAQQEFMNNVGNHIYCFIGADEAGTYGDLIEISID